MNGLDELVRSARWKRHQRRERARLKREERRARRRGIRFYGQFAAKDDLCFDVGANVGNRTGLLLEIPARVVAVEPQALCQVALEESFGDNPRFTLVRAALGPEPGTAEIRKTSSGSVYATLSSDWMARVKTSGRFAEFSWDDTERVEVTTLDTLIRRYGEPTFCKIDVEGYERQVLEGLSTPIRALSIEFTPEFLDATEECLALILGLGEYEFNYSLDESLVLAEGRWISREKLLDALDGFRDDPSTFGDVYARRSELTTR